MKKYLGLITTIIFLTIFGFYFFNNLEKFEPILDLSFATIIVVIFSKLLLILSNSLFLKEILKVFDKDIKFMQSIYVTVLSTAGNYFIPMRGGAGIRAVYLKKKFDFSYSHFISTLSGNYIIIFLLNSLLGLLALTIVSIRNQTFPLILFIFFGGIFFVTLLLSILKIPTSFFDKKYRFPFFDKFTDIISKIVTGWNDITSKKALVIKLVIFALLNFFSALIGSFVEFSALGVDLSVWGLVLYSSLASLTVLISITPGSLGIREAVLIVFSSVIGITNIEILQVAVIDRGIMFLVLFVLFILAKVFPQK